MAMGTLTVAIVLMVPVGICWRIAFNMLSGNPTRQVKLAFWVLSGPFVALALVAYLAVSNI